MRSVPVGVIWILTWLSLVAARPILKKCIENDVYKGLTPCNQNAQAGVVGTRTSATGSKDNQWVWLLVAAILLSAGLIIAGVVQEKNAENGLQNGKVAPSPPKETKSFVETVQESMLYANRMIMNSVNQSLACVMSMCPCSKGRKKSAPKPNACSQVSQMRANKLGRLSSSGPMTDYDSTCSEASVKSQGKRAVLDSTSVTERGGALVFEDTYDVQEISRIDLNRAMPPPPASSTGANSASSMTYPLRGGAATATSNTFPMSQSVTAKSVKSVPVQGV